MQRDFARKKEPPDLAWELVGFGLASASLGHGYVKRSTTGPMLLLRRSALSLGGRVWCGTEECSAAFSRPSGRFGAYRAAMPARSTPARWA